MYGKRMKRLLAFLLAAVLAVSNMSFVYAGDEAGVGTGDGTGSGGETAHEISGGDIINENGIYAIKDGSTGTITIDAAEVTLIGGGKDKYYQGLFIDCNKEKTSLTIQDIWISNNNKINPYPTLNFKGEGNYLYLKGTSLFQDINNSSDNAIIHVGLGTALTIDNSENGSSTGSLYFASAGYSPGIGGNRNEANGDITVSGGRLFGIAGKNGAAIGTSTSTQETAVDPDSLGDIRITGGEVVLAGMSLNTALIGGNYSGGKVFISGGLVSLTLAEAKNENGSPIPTAIGGEKYEVSITGGSVKTYIGELVTAYEKSEDTITAKKTDNNGELVYPLTLDVSEVEGDSYTIAIDGISYYQGTSHQYATILEKPGSDGFLDFTAKKNKLPTFTINWEMIPDTNLYLYATKGDHKVSVNGTNYLYTWNETTQVFENKGIITESLTAGRTGNGEITVSTSQPKKEDEVTVTAAPSEGSYLAQMRCIYTDEQGKNVVQVIRSDAGGAYKFTMPADNAQVMADFIPIKWDGTIDLTWYDPAVSVYNIKYAAQLAGVAALNNGIFNNYPCEDNGTGQMIPAVEENGTPKGSTGSLYNVYGTGDAQTAVVGDITAVTAQPGTDSESGSLYWYGKEDFRGKTINLSQDIDMGGSYIGDELEGKSWSGPNYMPIGGQYCMDPSNKNTLLRATFLGTFNGQGHLVDNIYCSRASDSSNTQQSWSVGLIGHMGSFDGSSLSGYTDPDVKNTAVDGYLTAEGSVAGIVGKSTAAQSVVQSCMNFALVERSGNYADTDKRIAAGIVGEAENSLTIKSCVNFGKIHIGHGICGISDSARVFDSYNFGSTGISSPLSGLGLGSSKASGTEDTLEEFTYKASWINCYWLSDTHQRGTSDDVYFKQNIEIVSDPAVFKSSSFLEKINSTESKELKNLHDFYSGKEPAKISATGRDWVSGTGFISEGVKSALAEVKTYKLINSGNYTVLPVDCSTFAVPRAFTQDESVLNSITFEGAPKTEYISGQEFDMNTLKIWADYSDGTKEAVTDYKITTDTTGNELSVNDKKAVISGNYKGKSFSYTYDLSVTANKLVKIEIANPSRNLLYAAGESLDKKGMVVKATYTNGKVLEIKDYTVSPSAFKAGDKNAVIGYTYEGETRNAIQAVTVLDSAAPAVDSENRVELRTANDMLWFANQVNTGTNQSIDGILMNDIDLSEAGWIPIGKYNIRYTGSPYSSDVRNLPYSVLYMGTLDGNGKSIKLDLTTTGNFGGFCSLLGSEGVIKNLTLEGKISASEGYMGAIAGWVYGGKVMNCTNNAKITGSGTAYVSGITGRVSNKGEILDCLNKGDITSVRISSGIAADAADALISRCINKGEISSTGSAYGILANVNYNSLVYNSKKIDCTISYCGNEGKITSGSKAAGIHGTMESSSSVNFNISFCYNTGAVSVSSETAAYGTVSGISNSAKVIESCYNTGELKGDVPGRLFIAGVNSYDFNTYSIIKNCYNAGKITAKGGTCYAGSIFIGSDSEVDNETGYVNILNNYALNGTADKLMGGFGVLTESNAAFKTSEELKALTVDLGDAYREGHISVNSGYPLLKWQPLGAVELVDKAIEELGEITLESKTALETVRAAYNSLSKEQQQYVTKISILEEAESIYKELAAARDKEAAVAVDLLIEGIGTVTLESGDLIQTVREAYDQLTEDQKNYVTKTAVLTAAENTYKALVKEKEKLEADKRAAQEVDILIEKIGTVSLNSKAAITEARESYEKLSSDQKALVTKLEVLKAAEEKLVKLTADKKAADQAAARIAALPEALTLSYEKAVEEARTAYEGLSEDQKSLVSNISRLAEAEAVIAKLKSAVEKAIEKIAEVQEGAVSISMESLPQLTETLLASIKESGKEVTFVKEESGKIIYSWTLKGSELGSVNAPISTNISFSTSNASAINALVGSEDSLYIHFEHHGILPGPVMIKLYAGDKYKDGDKVNLYYYNEETGKAEEISRELTVIDGYVTFTITHCSDYFLTKADLMKKPGTDIPNNTSVPVTDGKTGTAVATGDNAPLIPLILLMGSSLMGIFLTKKKAYK